MRRIVFSLALCVCPLTLAADNAPRIVNDGIPVALTKTPGDAERGRAIVANKQVSMCLLCHQAPTTTDADDKFQGTIATNLAGTGARWSEAQLRLRIVDSRRVNRESIMHGSPHARASAMARQNDSRCAANRRRSRLLGDIEMSARK
jgi:L-cysteine S-thiosulfotransferase